MKLQTRKIKNKVISLKKKFYLTLWASLNFFRAAPYEPNYPQPTSSSKLLFTQVWAWTQYWWFWIWFWFWLLYSPEDPFLDEFGSWVMTLLLFAQSVDIALSSSTVKRIYLRLKIFSASNMGYVMILLMVTGINSLIHTQIVKPSFNPTWNSYDGLIRMSSIVKKTIIYY